MAECPKGKGKGKLGRPTGKCWTCGNPGHLAHECALAGKQPSGKTKGKGKSAGGKTYALTSWDESWAGAGETSGESNDQTEQAQNPKDENPTANSGPTFIFSLTSASDSRNRDLSDGKGYTQRMGFLSPTLNAMRPGVPNNTDMVKVESFLDSGAARSVCPRTHCEQFPIYKTGSPAEQEGFQTATGKRVPNEGSRTVVGKSSDGAGVSMKYAVANIQVPLDSVSQMCDAGAVVTFTSSGGWIDLPSSERLTFKRRGDTYYRETWVQRTPFNGQDQVDP